MRSLFIASLVFFPASAVSAQAPNDGGKAEETKKICKIDPADTDSKIRRRICKTKEEWRRKSDDAKDSD